MPNNDLISRKALLNELGISPDEWAKGRTIIAIINDLSVVDAEPVRRARLLLTGYDEAWCEWGDCTNCGKSNIIGSKYCCKCGAYLEKER